MTTNPTGTVEEFLKLWASRLPEHIRKKPVVRWKERDGWNSLTLTVTWPRDKAK